MIRVCNIHISDSWIDSNAGKFLVGYMEVGGEKEYYLASACPELYAAPGAYISLLGLKVQGQFLGGQSNSQAVCN